MARTQGVHLHTVQKKMQSEMKIVPKTAVSGKASMKSNPAGTGHFDSYNTARHLLAQEATV